MTEVFLTRPLMRFVIFKRSESSCERRRAISCESRSEIHEILK